MDFIEEPFVGHTEEYRLQEYESIKDKINEKYECNMTALEVRAEFERAYNKLFEALLVEHSHEIFNILYVMMDCFNIDEIKAVRYLNKENKEMVRAFAESNFNTYYYENKEQQMLQEKGKGQATFENIEDLFS